MPYKWSLSKSSTFRTFQTFRETFERMKYKASNYQERKQQLFDDLAPQSLAIVAQSLSQLEKALGTEWSFDDFQLTFAALSRITVQSSNRKSDEPIGNLAAASVHSIRNTDLIKTFIRYALFAEVIYDRYPRDLTPLLLNLPESAIITREWKNELDDLRPAYFIAVDEKKQEIICSIRGTKDFTDGLVNLCMNAQQLSRGWVHTGIVNSTIALLRQVSNSLTDLKQKYPNFTVVFVGHSLGGAIASVSALLINENLFIQRSFDLQSIEEKEQHKKDMRMIQTLNKTLGMIHAFSFGGPSSVSTDLAEQCQSYVTTCIHGHDIIPRVRIAAFERLRYDLQQTPWWKDIQLNLIQHEMKLKHSFADSAHTFEGKLNSVANEAHQKLRKHAPNTAQHMLYQYQDFVREADEFIDTFSSTSWIRNETTSMDRNDSNHSLNQSNKLFNIDMNWLPFKTLQDKYNKTVLKSEKFGEKPNDPKQSESSYTTNETKWDDIPSISFKNTTETSKQFRRWKDKLQQSLLYFRTPSMSHDTANTRPVSEKSPEELYEAMQFVVPGQLYHLIYPTKEARKELWQETKFSSVASNRFETVQEKIGAFLEKKDCTGDRMLQETIQTFLQRKNRTGDILLQCAFAVYGDDLFNTITDMTNNPSTHLKNQYETNKISACPKQQNETEKLSSNTDGNTIISVWKKFKDTKILRQLQQYGQRDPHSFNQSVSTFVNNTVNASPSTMKSVELKRIDRDFKRLTISPTNPNTEIRETDNDYFSHIILSPYLVSDHSLPRTLNALKHCNQACNH